MKKLAVIDSGIGGLSVVRELLKLDNEIEINYFGDNIRVPYGNMSREEILSCMGNILDFLYKKGVTDCLVACNTMSSAILNTGYTHKIKLYNIVTPAIDEVKRLRLSKAAILATKFTIASKEYEKRLKAIGTDELLEMASASLAALIENFDDNRDIIEEELLNYKRLIDEGGYKNLILGCTHYEFIDSIFRDLMPEVEFIRPAKLLAESFDTSGLEKGDFNIYTTKDQETYIKSLRTLDIKKKLNIQDYIEI